MSNKASDNVKYYKNKSGPVIGSVKRKVIEKDGLYFKDIDNSGAFKAFDDWRLSPNERAKEYVKTLTLKEKIASLFISDWRMGKYPSLGSEHKVEFDPSGLLDEASFHGKTIFGEQHLPGTTTLLKELLARHIILRANPKASELVDWANQLQAVAEECDHFIPVLIASNSRNENGEMIFGMNEASGVFPTYPGTLGIAAAAIGDSYKLVDEFASMVKEVWDACGLKKGYMYMADILTDPRWQRSYGTFGECVDVVSTIIEHITPLIQGSKEGVTSDGVAMTIKHFPGGGARENGFDPHYKMGQWNVYQSEGSLEKYHIPSFIKAVESNVSSIMPYYAKPAKEKSAKQTDLVGNEIEMQKFGFAYNKPFIKELLREQMGFKGYINSDTGIVHNMSWGVEMLDIPERIAFALNCGVDLISGLFDMDEAMVAVERKDNGYYDEHPIPEGFKKEDIVLSEEVINKAVERTLSEMFALGLFENPYRDAANAEMIVSKEKYRKEAEVAHRKSVVLLKNKELLPLSTGEGKYYVECFAKAKEKGEEATKALRELLKDKITLTDDYSSADVAILLMNPSSGEYFSATKGFLELEVCENKKVCDVDDTGKPTEQTHEETTLFGVNKIKEIADDLHHRGGKVVGNINITLPWILTSVEKLFDGLTASFDTYPSAVIDILFGNFKPTGKLPVTLPRGDEVIYVNKDGVCSSPNDVPGYDKDKYIAKELKDENGKAYAYRDTEGNYYEAGFGLNY